MTGSAARAFVTEAEYLKTDYGDRPPEYIDGKLIERSMPNNFHSEVQGNLNDSFHELKKNHPVYTRPELRMRVGDGRYRIADFAMFHPEKPTGSIPPEIPYMVVEVVSPDDTYSETLAKLRDYRRLGVANVFLVDSQTRELAVLDGRTVRYVEAFELPALGYRITIDDLLKD